MSDRDILRPRSQGRGLFNPCGCWCVVGSVALRSGSGPWAIHRPLRVLTRSLLSMAGVVLAEDQPAAPASSTSPGAPTESSPTSKACALETTSTSAVPAKPAAARNSDAGKARGAGRQPPSRHRSEGGLAEKGPLERLPPHLSLSQRDLLDTDVSFQPWGSENSVRIPDPVLAARGSVREQFQSRSPQDSLSSSWPQCHTVVAKPEREPEDASRQVDPSQMVGLPLTQEGDGSEGEVAVTLVDTSQPGDPLSVHEPIKIVITMSSAQNSMTDLGSSLHLKATGAERTSCESEANPAAPGTASPPHVEQRTIPVITLELSEDEGGATTCPEGSGGQRTPETRMVEVPSAQRWGCESGEGPDATKDCSSPPGDPCETAPLFPPTAAPESVQGKEGQASLDPSSCKTSHEKRHARVLSVDSGTDVIFSKSSTEIVNDKEKTIPTSKSDLEAKEGQTPNESNFLEFVSLLESISTSKGVVPSRRDGPAEPDRETELLGGENHPSLS